MRGGFGIRENLVRSLNRVMNFGIDEKWDFDKKRAYRQVNAFSILISLAFFTTVFSALLYKNYGTAILELFFSMLVTLTFYFLSRGKLRQAQLAAIYGFEVNILIQSLFTVYSTGTTILPWYSPMFILYMLFPLTAALFDKNIFKHMFIGLLMILLIQFIAPYSSVYNYSTYLDISSGLIIIFVCLYSVVLASILVYFIYSGTRKVADLEIERSQKLEETISEVNTKKAVINKQANDLKALNESKNKLFSILAHDLKSPFNIMLGFSELLKEKSLNDPEYYQYAKQLYETSLTNYNLLENLLDWSRSQLNQIIVEPVNMRLNDTLTQSLDLVELSATKKGIEIINEIDDSIVIRADKSLLNIVFRNLLTNAIKFTNPGGKIVLGAKLFPYHAEISIKDNGIGMSEEMVRNLFMIENKQSRAGTLAETGTGLGLILCKEFTDKNGGEIRVKSTEHKGTTFYFTIPLAEITVPL